MKTNGDERKLKGNRRLGKKGEKTKKEQVEEEPAG